MDQFTNAERATDWRGNNNIAESIFDQMSQEEHSVPSWIVVGAGTGGTSATIGRFIRYSPTFALQTKLAVVDPENSVFYDYFHNRNNKITSHSSSRIEGIGRPRPEPSFQPDVIDKMIKVPDAASISSIRWLESILGRKCGGSTGTNLYAALQLAKEMEENNKSGSIVTLICDSGERYIDTSYNDEWLIQKDIILEPYNRELAMYS